MEENNKVYNLSDHQNIDGLVSLFNNEENKYFLIFYNKQDNYFFELYVFKEISKNEEELSIVYNNGGDDESYNFRFVNFDKVLVIEKNLIKDEEEFRNFYSKTNLDQIYIDNDIFEELVNKKESNKSKNEEIDLLREELKEIKEQNVNHLQEIQDLKEAKDQSEEMNASLVNQLVELQITMNEVITSLYDETE